MKTIIQLILLSAITASLTGCLAVAAGAAGGAYVEKHYDVSFKVKKKDEAENKK